ncbi:MAG: hypothetical protein E7339_06935 [Clostridiales bacterium]|nr:hypothetical protein [Clostridiales bacterium]
MRKNLLKILVVTFAMVCALAGFFGCKDISESSTNKQDLNLTIASAVDGTITCDYDGQSKAIVVEGIPDGVTVEITYAGSGETTYESSATAPVNAGTYTATVSAQESDGYKAFSQTVNLVINKIQNNFDLSCNDVVVGTAINPVVTNNLAGEPSFLYKGRGNTVYAESSEAPIEVGTYTVTATVASTVNYYGSRKSVDFNIYSDDPLYGVSAEIIAQTADLVSLNLTVAPESDYTNVGVIESTSGLIVAKNTHLMVEADFAREDSLTLIVYSSSATVGYFRFAIANKTAYADVVDNGIEYNKYYAGDIAIAEGYSILTIPMLAANGYVGSADAAVTGVHILLANEVEFHVCGAYQKGSLSNSDVPAELFDALSEKVALETSLSPASYLTNDPTYVRKENGIIEAKNNGLSIKADGLEARNLYLLVKSEVSQNTSFRFMVNDRHSYDDALNNAAAYNKYYVSVIIEEGYSIVHLTVLDGYCSSYTGDQKSPVTGVHIWGQGLLDSGLTVYGIYVDPVVEEEVEVIPEELLSALSEKTKLEMSLAPASYYTNLEGQVSQDEDGVIRSENTGLSIDVSGISGSKVYLLVKSDNTYTIDFRFMVSGKNTYPDALDVGDYYKYYVSGVAVAEGYSILEVSMVWGTNPGFTGTEDDAVTGLYLWSQGLLDYGFTLYGVYVDPVVEEEVEVIPEELLSALSEKTKLEMSLAPASYYTNLEGQVSQDEDGVIRSENTGLSIDVSGISGSKVYLLVKSDNTYTIDFRFMVSGKNTYPDALDVGDYYKYYVSGVAVAEGYSILEVSMVWGTNPGFTGTEDDAVTGLYLWSQGLLDYGFTLYGVYVDPVVEEEIEVIPEELLSALSEKTKLQTTLAPASYYTNTPDQVVQDDKGVIKAEKSGILFELNGVVGSKVYLLVKSEVAQTMDIRFMVEGKNTYVDAMYDAGSYKYFLSGVAVAEGYSIVELAMVLGTNPGFVGAEDEPVTGIFLWGQGLLDNGLNIYGVYVDADEIPASLLASLEGKTKLQTTLAPASYYTNTPGQVSKQEGGIINGANAGILFELNGVVGSKVYLLVKSEVAQTMDIRFMVEGKNTYVDAMYDAGSYKYFLSGVAVAEGYSIVELAMVLGTNPGFVGAEDEPVTGIFLWGQGLLDNGLNIYGVYVDADEIPASLLASLEGKTKLQTTLAPASYYTNTPGQVSKQEGGIINGANAGLAFDVSGISGSKIYLLVKSDNAYTIDFRFTTSGKNTYTDVIVVGDYYKYYVSGVAVAEGYSILEVSMVEGTNPGYTDGPDTPVSGLYLWSQGLLDYSIVIYGVYVD